MLEMQENGQFDTSYLGKIDYKVMRVHMHALHESIRDMFDLSQKSKPHIEISDNDERIRISIGFGPSNLHIMYHSARQKCLALFEGVGKINKREYALAAFSDVQSIELVSQEQAIICSDDLNTIKILPDGSRAESTAVKVYNPVHPMIALQQYLESLEINSVTVRPCEEGVTAIVADPPIADEAIDENDFEDGFIARNQNGESLPVSFAAQEEIKTSERAAITAPPTYTSDPARLKRFRQKISLPLLG